MNNVKPDNSNEIRYIATIIVSSVVLFVIFSTVWIIRKVKEGVL